MRVTTEPEHERARSRAYLGWVVLVIALGIGLRFEGLRGSLLADDWDHYAMTARTYPVARAPLDLFNFVGASQAEHAVLLRSGRLPWWTAKEIHLAALRPLSSALVWLDFALLDAAHAPWRAHLHSMLWWVLLLCAIAIVLCKVLPAPIAGLALLLYALDDAHTLPFAWNANRSELIALACVFFALAAHIESRARGRHHGGLFAPLLFALGLLGGEHAFAPLAYFAAYELIVVSGPLRERFRALLPVALLSCAYLVAHRALGYGVAGSGFYIDPLHNFARYASACVTRLPILFADLVFGFVADWRYGGPPWRPIAVGYRVAPAAWLSLESLRGFQIALGWIAIVATAWACVWLRRRRADSAERSVYWLLIGASASLVPMCSAVPLGRLTLAAGLGFDAGLGLLVYRLLRHALDARVGWTRAAAGLAVLALLGVHAVYDGAQSLRGAAFFADRSHSEEEWILHAEIDEAAIARQRVFLIAALDWGSQWGLPSVRRCHGRAVPASAELLSPVNAPHEILRTGERELELALRQPVRGFTFVGSVYRPEDELFEPGQKLACAHFDVTVLATNEGDPTRLRFTFPHSLDDPGYVFLYPRNRGLVRIAPPAIGTRLRLPAPAWPHRIER